MNAITESITGIILWYMSINHILTPYTTIAMYIFIGLAIISIIPIITKSFQNPSMLIKALIIFTAVFLILQAVVINPFKSIELWLLFPVYLFACLPFLVFAGMMDVSNKIIKI